MNNLVYKETWFLIMEYVPERESFLLSSYDWWVSDFYVGRDKVEGYGDVHKELS